MKSWCVEPVLVLLLQKMAGKGWHRTFPDSRDTSAGRETAGWDWCGMQGSWEWCGNGLGMVVPNTSFPARGGSEAELPSVWAGLGIATNSQRYPGVDPSFPSLSNSIQNHRDGTQSTHRAHPGSFPGSPGALP